MVGVCFVVVLVIVVLAAGVVSTPISSTAGVRRWGQGPVASRGGQDFSPEGSQGKRMANEIRPYGFMKLMRFYDALGV